MKFSNLSTYPRWILRMRHALAIGCVVTLLGSATGIGNAADRTAWSAGAAEIKITPGESV